MNCSPNAARNCSGAPSHWRIRPANGSTRCRAWVVGGEIAERSPALLMHDPTKIVLSLPGTGPTVRSSPTYSSSGDCGLEFADRDTFCPVITIGDTAETVDFAGHRDHPRDLRTPRRTAALIPITAWTLEPDTAMSPQDAFFADHERVPPHGRWAGSRPKPPHRIHPASRHWLRASASTPRPWRPCRPRPEAVPDRLLRRPDAGHGAGRPR